MLAAIREFLNKKPWVGWALAVVLLGVSVFFYFRSRRAGEDPYSPARMTEMVTIRFTDTEDEMTIPRGRLDKELRRQGDQLDPSKGIINPKTGKPTGFLFDKKEWDEWIARINKEKAEAKQHPNTAFSTAPASAEKK
jgi:hypothetical protein